MALQKKTKRGPFQIVSNQQLGGVNVFRQLPKSPNYERVGGEEMKPELMTKDQFIRMKPGCLGVCLSPMNCVNILYEMSVPKETGYEVLKSLYINKMLYTTTKFKGRL